MDGYMRMVSSPTRLEAFKEVCHYWLYIKNDEYIDVLFGVVFANRLDAKPVWLYLVAPPGGGKTEILQSWNGCHWIYPLSNLTENTLISGKVLDPNEPDPSLLPKLDGKVLVIKDFTVILTGKHDRAAAIFGQLRDIYDGTSKDGYGTGKDTEYKSKFGIIAAVTSVIDKHLRLLSSLGERFLTYRMPKLSEAEIEARTDLASENRSAKKQEEGIKRAAHDVLNLNPKPASISEKLRKQLGKMAQFVAIARTEIRRDGQSKEIEAMPDAEIPTRLVKQLVSLAQGIAMAREREEVTQDEVRLVQRVALGSVPPMRLEVLRRLIEVYPKSMCVKDIAEKLKLISGHSTVERQLQDWHILEIVERSKSDNELQTPWDWTVTEKYGELLREIEL